MQVESASMSSEPMLGPSRAQRFLEAEDLSMLDKPLQFPRHAKFGSYLSCAGAVTGLFSYGLSALFCPVGTFANHTLQGRHNLRLDKDAVRFEAASNDFCCHIATTQKTVPLDKIQDVELRTNCALSCFGLKALNIQTAGQGGPQGAPEVAAVFLHNPEETREAIQLAVKLAKQAVAAPPMQATMQRTTAPVAASADSLMARLQRMNSLVQLGVLSEAEAASIKAAVLGAEADVLGRLAEAVQLRDMHLLSQEELEEVKRLVLGRLT